jgi:hypothetical protein
VTDQDLVATIGLGEERWISPRDGGLLDALEARAQRECLLVVSREPGVYVLLTRDTSDATRPLADFPEV